MQFSSGTLFHIFLFFLISSVQNVAKREIPVGMMRGLKVAMQDYEETKTCASYMKIISKVTGMEKVYNI